MGIIVKTSLVTIATLSLVTIGVNVSADVITNPSSGSTLYVPEIGTWVTTSSLMNGMEVSVKYSDGSFSDVLKWGSGYLGGVSWDDGSGNGWKLYMPNPTGSTYSNGFTFEATGNIDISQLLMNAFAGDSVFDINTDLDPTTTHPDRESTINSKDGNPIAESYVDAYGTAKTSIVYSGFDVAVSYIDPVAIYGETPVGDLFGSLSLNFFNTLTEGSGKDFVGFSRYSSLYFIADTDNIKYDPVPEPTTLLLFGVGCITLFGRRFKSARYTNRI